MIRQMTGMHRLRSARLQEIKNVTVAGVTGAIGLPIIRALLGAGFNVQALSQTTQHEAVFPVRKVDYNDARSLRRLLDGQDAVVSCLGDTRSCMQAQKALIEASLETSVTRFIPSEYGSDTTHPYVKRLPFFESKLRHQGMLEEGAARRKDFSYTILITGLFLDWCLSTVPCIINVGSRSAQVYDGGNLPFSVTRTSTVASAVTKILQTPRTTSNKVYKIHETVTTQNELITKARSLFDHRQGFNRTHVDTTTYERNAWRAFTSQYADPLDWMVPFINLSIWSEERPGHFERIDNEHLDIPVLTLSERAAVINAELLSAIGQFSRQQAKNGAMTATADQAYEAGKAKLVDQGGL